MRQFAGGQPRLSGAVRHLGAPKRHPRSSFPALAMVPAHPASYGLVSSRQRLKAFITGASLKLNKKAGRSPLLTCSQNVHVGTVNTSLSSQSSRWSPTAEYPAPSTTSSYVQQSR